MTIDESIEGIMLEIEAHGGLVTPEQEVILDRISRNLPEMAATLFEYSVVIRRLKELELLVRNHRKSSEAAAQVLRERTAVNMEKLGMSRTEDPNGYATLSLQQGRGRVEIVPGMSIDDVDPMYRKREVKEVVDADLARPVLEAGNEIRGLCLVVDNHVVLRKTKLGKVAELEMDAARRLGLVIEE